MARTQSSIRCEIIRKLVSRITVLDSSIKVEISRAQLRSVLKADYEHGPLPRLETVERPSPEQQIIRLNIEAKLARHGLKVRVIVPPGTHGAEEPAYAAVPSLVKAVVRPYCWQQEIMQGQACDQRSLAKQEGLSERYVGKVFEGAFLAPDIVEGILQGRQPQDLPLNGYASPSL